MGQIYAALDHALDPWQIAGPEEATSVSIVDDVTVHYSTGGSDTIVGQTVATVVGSADTIFDRSTAVWVIYTIPGSGALYAVLESQLVGLSGDWAPLIRVLRHRVQPYQPQQPGGAAIKSGAWSGGAFVGVGRAISGGGYYGVFDSQSIQGGGSVSGVSCNFTTNGCGNYAGGMALGFFFKVASLPGGTMALVDLDTGSVGHLRVSLTSAGHVLMESTIANGSVSNDMGAIATMNWYWVTVGQGCGGSLAGYSRMQGQLWQSGVGILSSFDTGNYGVANVLGGSVSTTLGWGVHLSSAYADFPNTTGNELSKLMIKDSSSLIAMPSSDPSTVGWRALYLCRQSVGAVASLTDSSGNSYNLAAGGSGCQIVADGPYA